MSLINVVSACGAVGSAVVGGVYATFSARVMPRLGSLPDAEAIETMQRFNRQALELPFTTLFFGSALASAWTVVHGLRAQRRTAPEWLCVAGGALYLAGWVMTIAYNVPRNDRLAAVAARTPEGSQVWHVYLAEWTSANGVRAVLTLVGAVALGAGTVLRILAGRAA